MEDKTMSDVVKRANDALEDTTPGPWEADLDPHGETRGIWPTGPGEEIVIGNYVRADGFESVDWAGGSDENLRFIAAARTLVPELVTEVERLRRFVAIVEGFITERASYITAIENCAPDNTADYWRWQGHAESRRQLLAELPWPPDTDDAERISKQARVTR